MYILDKQELNSFSLRDRYIENHLAHISLFDSIFVQFIERRRADILTHIHTYTDRDRETERMNPHTKFIIITT